MNTFRSVPLENPQNSDGSINSREIAPVYNLPKAVAYKLGPEAGFTATLAASVWQSIDSLGLGNGLKPGSRLLEVYTAGKSTGTSVLTVDFSYDGVTVRESIAVNITANGWLDPAVVTALKLANSQYCNYVRWAFTLGGNGTVTAYLVGEGASYARGGE